MQEVIIATNNAGKAREFERMFTPLGFEVKTLLDYPDFQDVEETGSTFEENAILKAEAVSKAFGRMVIADDSGLIIDALGGSRASIPPAMQERKKTIRKIWTKFSVSSKEFRITTGGHGSIALLPLLLPVKRLQPLQELVKGIF